MPAASAAPRCAASIPSKIDLQRLLAYVHPVILDACSRRVIGWALERTLGDERQTLVGQVRSSRDLAICSWPDHFPRSSNTSGTSTAWGSRLNLCPERPKNSSKQVISSAVRLYSFPRHMSNAEAQRAELVLDFGHLALPTRRELAEEVGRFYERHYDSLYRYLILSGSTQEEACDLLQEGFLRLWEHAITRNRIERPRSWLVRCTISASISNGGHGARLAVRPKGRWSCLSRGEAQVSKSNYCEASGTRA